MLRTCEGGNFRDSHKKLLVWHDADNVGDGRYDGLIAVPKDEPYYARTYKLKPLSRMTVDFVINSSNMCLVASNDGDLDKTFFFSKRVGCTSYSYSRACAG